MAFKNSGQSIPDIAEDNFIIKIYTPLVDTNIKKKEKEKEVETIKVNNVKVEEQVFKDAEETHNKVLTTISTTSEENV